MILYLETINNSNINRDLILYCPYLLLNETDVEIYYQEVTFYLISRFWFRALNFLPIILVSTHIKTNF
jgi:hypothetical protein